MSDRPSSTRTTETVRATGLEVNKQLANLGFDVQNCIVDLGETAEMTVTEVWSQDQFACIMIGAGIRALPEQTLLFEQIINLVHEHAPTAKLCFNTNPGDTVEAVQQWAQAWIFFEVLRLSCYSEAESLGLLPHIVDARIIGNDKPRLEWQNTNDSSFRGLMRAINEMCTYEVRLAYAVNETLQRSGLKKLSVQVKME